MGCSEVYRFFPALNVTAMLAAQIADPRGRMDVEKLSRHVVVRPLDVSGSPLLVMGLHWPSHSANANMEGMNFVGGSASESSAECQKSVAVMCPSWLPSVSWMVSRSWSDIVGC